MKSLHTALAERRRSGLLLTAVAILGVFIFACTGFERVIDVEEQPTSPPAEVTEEVGEVVPTITLEPTRAETTPQPGPSLEEGYLSDLYKRLNPGVVNIRVYVEQQGMTRRGGGSGFVLNEEGDIVTNDHVVSQAEVVTVIFHNGLEVRADIVGTDDDSDLAVLSVDEMPEDVVSLPLAASDDVEPGDWVIAIGNPFSLGGSMSLGIVSATGRAIPGLEAGFRIPRAIQTDAAINPGNSGGPLLNLNGEVVGVNAQIATGGQSRVNSGVGFAIPSSVVRRVVPALIQEGAYAWPWLGVEGLPVNLLIQQANELSVQRGAYIARIVPDGPADEAGLRGATASESILGTQVPIGGDIVLEADGQAIQDFTDLLAYVSFQEPGQSVELTILRDGEQQQVTVELAARPEDMEE